MPHDGPLQASPVRSSYILMRKNLVTSDHDTGEGENFGARHDRITRPVLIFES